MKTTTTAPNYRGYRFPPEIISHCIWLYVRFSLSFRESEEIMAERGIIVTSETIRQWTLKFGQMYANELKRRRGKMGDTWHLDEVYLKINGKTHYLWRAVDQDGNVLDMRVAEPTQQKGGEEILSETAQRTSIRATSDYHRQAGQLRRRKEGDHGKCEASTTQGLKQPSGTDRSAEQATRANHAAVQIKQSRPNGFSPRLGRLWITFGPNGIASLQRITVLSCRIASWSGTRWPEERRPSHSEPSFPILRFSPTLFSSLQKSSSVFSPS